MRGPGIRLAGLCLAPRGLGLGQNLLGGLGGCHGLGLARLGGGKLITRPDKLHLGSPCRLMGLPDLCLGARQRRADVTAQPLRGLMARKGPRRVLGQRGEVRFAFGQHCRRAPRRFGRLVQPRIMALMGARDLSLFPVKPPQRLAGIAIQPGLAFHVPRKLRDPGLEHVD